MSRCASFQKLHAHMYLTVNIIIHLVDTSNQASQDIAHKQHKMGNNIDFNSMPTPPMPPQPDTSKKFHKYKHVILCKLKKKSEWNGKEVYITNEFDVKTKRWPVQLVDHPSENALIKPENLKCFASYQHICYYLHVTQLGSITQFLSNSKMKRFEHYISKQDHQVALSSPQQAHKLMERIAPLHDKAALEPFLGTKCSYCGQTVTRLHHELTSSLRHPGDPGFSNTAFPLCSSSRCKEKHIQAQQTVGKLGQKLWGTG